MRNSDKQSTWANDIRDRITILLNAFVVKCENADSDENKKLINKVSNIITNSSSDFLIDEYKCITDDSLIKMFEHDDIKYCKLFKMMFSGETSLYQIQQKKRLSNKRKLDSIKAQFLDNYNHSK